MTGNYVCPVLICEPWILASWGYPKITSVPTLFLTCVKIIRVYVKNYAELGKNMLPFHKTSQEYTWW